MKKKKKRKKRPETGMDRLRAVALWQWGLIVIFAGIVSNLVMGMQSSSGGSAAARGEALGRAVAALLFITIGIGMIVTDLFRRRR